MSENDVAAILRAVGKLEGIVDAAVNKLSEVHDYTYRIDSKLNGAILEAHTRMDAAKAERETLRGDLEDHISDDNVMRGDLKSLKKWVKVAGAVGVAVFALLAPDKVPEAIRFIASLL